MTMAETLTPKSISIHYQKPPLAGVAAPTSPFFLGSNDDQLERAAARAASFRRKPAELPHSRDSLSSDSCLDRHQIMELFHNCVKLATENKINQKNTWELKLIDHLSEIIKVEAEDNNAETNFQKCLGKKNRRRAGNASWQEGSGFSEAFPAWDNGGAYSGLDDDGYAQSDIEEQDILVFQPRQEVQEDAISFKQVLASFPDDCSAAAVHDISPHLCFICLLHLANEHGLTIQGCTDMDDLSVHLPVSS